ncbi:alpha/beta hydrolase [Kurthia sibirica]|uniref:Alpha/beta hydrolase n=1 Tax=Kurthia sibirica TaxID=202750 RepID=A0A2U3AJ55_9BACL|nr:alpha/beta hydrolase [Kurthia sibirica]PWI24569.1 alpha/beta hydrolase [Kurthia sibirica]GEK33522.1 carboxymethylenebutenolidase [Kurthia sibirica]
MNKSTKTLLFILASIIVVGVFLFYMWTQQTYKGTAELESLVPAKSVKKNEDLLVFEPKVKTETGIILYPGAKVEPMAYRYLASELAKNGYFVAIPKMMLNIAIFDTTKAEKMMLDYPNISRWVIGGHSLGGVAAANYVSSQPKKVVGLLLLASYPSNKVDFSEGTLSTLSIYAQYDQVTTPEAIMNTQNKLSTNAILHEIKGGNHAGFGMYGKQKDDGVATISNLEQQKRIVYQVVRWLDKVTGKENEKGMK